MSSAKNDENKLDLTMVPRQIIWDIAAVRRYGNKKYGSQDNWKTVEPERYRAAAFRHFLEYLDDPLGVDEESGLPHLWHLACNIAFLCEMETWRKTMKTDECCGSCKWRITDVDGKTICDCGHAADWMEDVSWQHSCVCWEADDDE